jgi:hypothetical protein
MTLPKISFGLILAITGAMSASLILAEPSPSAAIADGQPWHSTGPGGRPMTLTFYPDGQVRANLGLFSMSMIWTPTDDGMCLSGGPEGDKCITFVKTDSGYQGIEDGQVTMQLIR